MQVLYQAEPRSDEVEIGMDFGAKIKPQSEEKMSFRPGGEIAGEFAANVADLRGCKFGWC